MIRTAQAGADSREEHLPLTTAGADSLAVTPKITQATGGNRI